MKKTKSLFKIILSLSVALTITAGFIVNRNVTPTKVEATQYLGDYDPYTYNGSYYNTINFDAAGGMNGALRQSLTSLIKPAGFYTYGSSGETHLSTQLQYADEDPTNSSNMIYFYTRNSVTKTAATVNSTIMWNREHVWCQSLSNDNWGTTEAGTDILHLRPTYESTNKSRGNTPYGNTGHATKKTYNQMDFGWTGNGYFEPLDCVKGDVARIIMYLWTTYTGYPGYSALNILNVFQSYDTLLSWHTSDKPDALEGNRNNYCQSSRQKNRNPFVDHPELAWKIFGDNASSSVKNACMAAYPADGSTPGPNPVDDDSTRVTLSLADYATANSIAHQTKVTSIALDSVVTASANGSDANTGKIYIGTNMTEWRFYSSGSGTLNISVADGYTLLSAKGQIGTSNYGSPTEVNFNVSNNCVSYNPGTNFNVKSLEATYQEEEVPTYTVTFNTNGGSSVSDQAVEENDYATIPNDPTKDSDENYNYTFDSWYSDAGLNNEYDFDTPVTEDITLYAKWIRTNRNPAEVIENIATKTSLAYRYAKEGNEAVTDVLNNAFTEISGTTYTAWSNKTGTSGAIYAGKSAGGNSSIQLRTKNSEEGVVITSNSGQTVQSVTVTWNEGTNSSRVLDIYGKNEAYTAATDLFGDDKGTLLGSMACSAKDASNKTSITIGGSYSYIGIRSHGDALYLDSIEIEWASDISYTFPRAGIRFTGQISVALWNRLNSSSTIQGYGILLSDDDFLGDDELKDYYELADNISVKDFYRPLSEKAHPDTTNNDQDYVWSLFKSVTTLKFKTVYVAAAYIKTSSGLVFLNQTEASVKSLATTLLSKDGNNSGSYEGSLHYLSHLD